MIKQEIDPIIQNKIDKYLSQLQDFELLKTELVMYEPLAVKIVGRGKENPAENKLYLLSLTDLLSL